MVLGVCILDLRFAKMVLQSDFVVPLLVLIFLSHMAVLLIFLISLSSSDPLEYYQLTGSSHQIPAKVALVETPTIRISIQRNPDHGILYSSDWPQEMAGRGLTSWEVIDHHSNIQEQSSKVFPQSHRMKKSQPYTISNDIKLCISRLKVGVVTVLFRTKTCKRPQANNKSEM